MVSVNPVIDSRMSFAQAIYGSKAPEEVIKSLCLMDVAYFSFDGCLHQGQLLIHESIRKDILVVFSMIEELRYPVARVIPIAKYLWSDDASMADNNTSAFNYRFIAGTEKLSHHARGMAVDINPFKNPVVYPDHRVSPSGAVYDCKAAGALTEYHPIVRAFLERGWQWGGRFKDIKDYHHFEKTEPAL